MRELVLLTHAIQRRSSAGADCSWPALDARGGAPVWETPQAQAPPQRAAGSRKARAWASLARHRELGRSSSAPYSWLQISARRLNQKWPDRKSTRLNSSHSQISYAVFCLKKKKKQTQ